MGDAEVAGVALLVIAYAAVSMRAERLPVSMPMLFVAAGVFAGFADLVDVSADLGAIALLAEVTLAVILFSDAVRIDLGRLRRHLSIPARLLGIGLPLTMVLGAMVNSFLFPDLAIVQVALLAAILAPTDAALGAAVVEDRSVPIRERLALNVESGVNDGLAVPVVAVLTAALLGESRSTASWIGFVVRQVGGGVLLGVGLGAAAIFVLRRAKDAGWADGRYTQLATFFVPIAALFGASAMSVNSFIAAFAAGLTFGSVGRRVVGEAVERDDAEMFDEFTEDAAQLFGVAAFFIFGNVLLTDAIDEISWPIVVCALLTLTLGRMLPVWISLTGTGMKAPTRLFLGWFGPRGLASIVFALLLLEDMEAAGEPSEVAESILDVVAITVTASVVLHGASASIGARRYGKWAAAQAEDEMGSDMMDDVDERVLPRSRWSLRR